MTNYINMKNFTLAEQKYIILSNFWCRENNIKIKMTDCVPLEDGSYDSSLISRSDVKNKIIYMRKDIEDFSSKKTIIHIIDSIIPFLFYNNNINFNIKTIEEFSNLANKYLFDSYNINTIKDDESFYKFNMEIPFDFIIWIKEKANA